MPGKTLTSANNAVEERTMLKGREIIVHAGCSSPLVPRQDKEEGTRASLPGLLAQLLSVLGLLVVADLSRCNFLNFIFKNI